MFFCLSGRRVDRFLVMLAACVALGRGTTAEAQVTAKTLVGKAVSNDSQSSGLATATSTGAPQSWSGLATTIPSCLPPA
jgi:hypothetical protein